MASTEAEDPSQSLKYKTSVLRVSIHCQGCKRKVHKLLQSVPGVQEIQIEPKQQRVVVTGDVSPETLLRKLVKAGKHAELWPELKPPEIRPQEPEKPPTTNQGSVSEESPVSVTEIKPPTTKPEKPVEDPKKVNKTAAPGGEPAVINGKSNEGVGKTEGGKDKPEEKNPETDQSACNQAVSEKKEEKTEKEVVGGGGGGGGGGEGKKKKKKKPQNGDKIGTSSGPPPPSIERSVNGGGGGSPPPTRPPIDRTPPPQHQGYQYPPPPHYYTPPPAPVYTVSYNTAQPPVNSYTASYYATPPPQSYAYSHYGGSEMGPPPHVPPDYDSYRQQPSDSFEMFSDENPNGCLVM